MPNTALDLTAGSRCGLALRFRIIHIAGRRQVSFRVRARGASPLVGHSFSYSGVGSAALFPPIFTRRHFPDFLLAPVHDVLRLQLRQIFQP